MSFVEVAKLIKELGLSVASFALCVWVVMFIVKRLATSIDKLVQRMEVFTSRVRDEHDASQKQHEQMMAQHEKIMEIGRETMTGLGRINGFKND